MQSISRENLFAWLDGLKADYEVYVPVKKGPFRFYQQYTSPSADIVIGEVRAIEPVKAFFTPAREKVAELFNPEIPQKNQKPSAIVGVKACDLKGFLVQDGVFSNHRCQDPFYNRARQDNVIISADCTIAIDTCFCLALGVQPYPESHFDINLSEIKGGFIVEVGSNKGQQILENHKSFFQQVDTKLLNEREERRKRVVAEVQS